VHVWLQRPNGDYLIQQRAATKELPLLWASTGGAVLHNEQPLEAAIREVQEELGISLRAEQGELLREERVVLHPTLRRHLFIYRFAIDVLETELKLQPEEVQAARYASLDEIVTMHQQGEFFCPQEHLSMLRGNVLVEVPPLVLFDFWDTLVYYQFDATRANTYLLTLAEANPRGVTATDLNQLAVSLLRDLRKEGNIEIHHYDFQHYLYEALGVQMSLPPEAWEDAFLDHGYELCPVEGIQPLLRNFDEHGIRYGVLSTTMLHSRSLKRILSKILPEFKFEFVLASSEYIFKKPHPRFFDVALHRSKLAPRDILYVGDTFDTDVVGANAVGMSVVWLNHKHKPRLEALHQSYTLAYSYDELRSRLVFRKEEIQ
jgi:putative hydrolase of the HAD superfamily